VAEQFGKYVLDDLIAVGGMAEIFLARQQGPAGFEKRLIVKRILPQYAADEAFIEMFLDEARLTSRLSHPNIVQIFELGEEQGRYYIAMEYIQGEGLIDVMDAAARLGVSIPYHYAATIIGHVAAGLDYAHHFTDADGRPFNLVHRDISPDNILVSYNGAVKTIDFGIAKAVTNRTKTQAGAVKGKFCYMSPEQVMAAELDGRSDIFSLGITLYEMTTGRRPFGEDDGLLTVSAIVNEPVKPPSELVPGFPPALERIILRALAKDRDQRYARARDLQRDLEEFVQRYARIVSQSDIGELVKALRRGQARDATFVERLQREVKAPAGEEEQPTEEAVPSVWGPAVSHEFELPSESMQGSFVAASRPDAIPTRVAGARFLRTPEEAPQQAMRRSVLLGVGGGLALLVLAIVLFSALSGDEGGGAAAVVAADERGDAQGSPAAEEPPGENADVEEADAGEADAGEADTGELSVVVVSPRRRLGSPGAPTTLRAQGTTASADAGAGATAPPTPRLRLSGPPEGTNGAGEVAVAKQPGVAPSPANAGVLPSPAGAATVPAQPASRQPTSPPVPAAPMADAGATVARDAGDTSDAGPKPLAVMRWQGRLTVEANLEGAEVFANGRRLGLTPLHRQPVFEGRYVVIVRAGVTTWRGRVTVVKDRDSSVRAVLKAGRVTLAGVPEGVPCKVDGVSLRRAFYAGVFLPAGAHEIACDDPATDVWTKRIELSPGAQVSLTYDQ